VTQILDQIRALLSDWVGKCFTPMTWRDYYAIAKSYARVGVNARGELTAGQEKRLRVFCRWFSALQALSLPEHAHTLLQLERASDLIRRYPEAQIECRHYMQQFASFKQTQAALPEVRHALNEARRAEAYSGADDEPPNAGSENPRPSYGV
jgi:hypothetical protein